MGIEVLQVKGLLLFPGAGERAAVALAGGFGGFFSMFFSVRNSFAECHHDFGYGGCYRLRVCLLVWVDLMGCGLVFWYGLRFQWLDSRVLINCSDNGQSMMWTMASA